MNASAVLSFLFAGIAEAFGVSLFILRFRQQPQWLRVTAFLVNVSMPIFLWSLVSFVLFARLLIPALHNLPPLIDNLPSPIDRLNVLHSLFLTALMKAWTVSLLLCLFAFGWMQQLLLRRQRFLSTGEK